VLKAIKVDAAIAEADSREDIFMINPSDFTI
jgi:hypothetical protein